MQLRQIDTGYKRDSVVGGWEGGEGQTPNMTKHDWANGGEGGGGGQRPGGGGGGRKKDRPCLALFGGGGCEKGF